MASLVSNIKNGEYKLYLLHSERPKLHRVVSFPGAKWLSDVGTRSIYSVVMQPIKSQTQKANKQKNNNKKNLVFFFQHSQYCRDLTIHSITRDPEIPFLEIYNQICMHKLYMTKKKPTQISYMTMKCCKPTLMTMLK